MNLVVRLAINVAALLVVEKIVPGFYLADLTTAVIAAIMIGAINTFIRPILQIVALPISILTLGVSAFLINVFLLWATSLIVPGFVIDGFVTAIVGSVVLSLVSLFLHKLASE